MRKLHSTGLNRAVPLMRRGTMLKPLLGALVAGAVIATSSPLHAQVNVKSDGATTVFSVGPAGNSGGFDLSAAFQCPDGFDCNPGVVRLLFSTQSQTPKHKYDHAVSFLVDTSVTVDAPKTQYVQKKGLGKKTHEVIIWLMPIRDFLSVAAAREVEYQVGPSTGKLSKKQLEILASLAERIVPAPVPDS